MNYHRILAAFDGSEPAEKALRHAVGIIDKQPGSKLIVAYVKYRPAFSMEGFGWIAPTGYEENLQAVEDAVLRKAETRIANLAYAEIVMLKGNPALAILDCATKNNCDLIVMGSRGMGAIKELMLGSVSHHVVQQAKIPVLIVK